MSDSVNVLNFASSLYTAPNFSPFTGVKMWLDDTNFVFSGNENGRVLEADLPWATQQIADNVLASIVGFQYQPFSAQNALLNPAAELGDGVSVGGVYSVLAACDTNFNAMCASSISAPSDEEIEHEYHYTSPEKRLERRVSKMAAELRVTAEGITARVENAEGMASEAQQTAEGFSQRITDAEGNITEIKISLEGVVYASSLADGTTVINGGCITTGIIDAERIDVTKLKVSNGNITSLDVGKLTVGGQPISGSNAQDVGYFKDVVIQPMLGQTGHEGSGELELRSVASGGVVLDYYGIASSYGVGGEVSWNKIIEVAQNGGSGSSTAVFG